jgi:hypothetical protein
MKILGTAYLHEDFEWKPQQLLAMIKEIDKICPEGGKPNDLINNPEPQTHDTNSNTSYE